MRSDLVIENIVSDEGPAFKISYVELDNGRHTATFQDTPQGRAGLSEWIGTIEAAGRPADRDFSESDKALLRAAVNAFTQGGN